MLLTSFAIIFLFGLFAGGLFQKSKLPALMGMVIVGILISPHAFHLLDSNMLAISADLRKIALIIILTRAGLSLDLNDLKQVGRPAILLCFVPATFEILGCVLLAPKLLGVSVVEAAIIGSVIAAVSPAVVVPHMLKLMKEKYGTAQSIPQMVMAAASIDDVYAIVLFTVFTGLASGGSVSASSFLQIPISIVLGIAGGLVTGYLLYQFFQWIKPAATTKVLVLLSISFLLTATETWLEGKVPFASLLAVMTASATIYYFDQPTAKELSKKFSDLWAGASVWLFVLVGATVDMKYALAAGAAAVLLIFGALIMRMIGVQISLLKTKLNKKERLFTSIAYMPKATVQAAIGSIPLAMGLACGQTVLTVAVLSILITAPLGAFFIDLTYKKLLRKANA